MAGLPGSNARVRVGPPLFCSGPSRGSSGTDAEPTWSVWTPAPKPVLSSPSPIRLKPLETKSPVASGALVVALVAALVAIIESPTLNTPLVLATPPPAPAAELRAIVLLMSTTGPDWLNTPPPKPFVPAAVFAAIVLLLMVAEPPAL